MRGVRFEISRRRFHSGWLVLGAVYGSALGHYGALNFAYWYFAKGGAIVGWMIFGAIAGALFISFLMTSNATLHTKGAILGLGAGATIAFLSCAIWAATQTGRDPGGLQGISVGEGVFMEWIIMHGTFLGIILGWIAGAIISRRNHPRRPAEASSPEEPEG